MIFLGLFIVALGCTDDQCVDLQEKDKFGIVKTEIGIDSKICLDVSELEKFDFVHVMTNERFYIIDRQKNQDKLLIDRNTCTPVDTSGTFTNFRKNDTISVWMGNRISKDNIGMKLTFLVELINKK